MGPDRLRQRMIEDCEDELKQIDVGDLETLTTEARRLEGLVYEKKQARIAQTEQLRNEHNLRNADKEREASEKRAGLNGQINELSVLLRSMTDKYQLEHEELSQDKKAVESEKAELTSRFVSAEREENRALAQSPSCSPSWIVWPITALLVARPCRKSR